MKQMINRNDQAPIYEQIYENLRLRIESPEYSAGAAFPSERELAETFGVSRMTVRQALSTLRHEGLIYNERGIGTFVSKRKIDVHTRNLVGFTDEMKSLGLYPTSKLLLLARESATDEAAKNLMIEPGDEVIHLQRLRLADGSPMAFEDTLLPAARFPGIDKFSLEDVSLYQILEDKYGVKMSHAEEMLEARSVPPAIAALLSVKNNSPVLQVHRVVFSESNDAVESVRTLYRSDRYRATFRLTKNGK